MCQDKVAVVNDYFIADFDTNLTYHYYTIKAIEKNQNKIYLQSKNHAEILEFSIEQEAMEFMKALQKRIK